MKTLYVTDTGYIGGNDLQLDGQNNLKMVNGADEKLQSVRLLLSTNTGEWFLNADHGLDYFAFLGQKWPDSEEETRAVFMEAFEQEPRIEEVLSLDFEHMREERKLKVKFRLRMEGEEVEGETEVEG